MGYRTLSGWRCVSELRSMRPEFGNPRGYELLLHKRNAVSFFASTPRWMSLPKVAIESRRRYVRAGRESESFGLGSVVMCYQELLCQTYQVPLPITNYLDMRYHHIECLPVKPEVFYRVVLSYLTSNAYPSSTSLQRLGAKNIS